MSVLAPSISRSRATASTLSGLGSLLPICNQSHLLFRAACKETRKKGCHADSPGSIDHAHTASQRARSRSASAGVPTARNIKPTNGVPTVYGTILWVLGFGFWVLG